jgi:hypothetical protein
MKKFLLIGSLVVVGILVFGAVGIVYAQSQLPMDGERPIGERAIHMSEQMTSGGMMNSGRGGMLGQQGSGLLHDYMLAGFAAVFDMDVTELEARHDAGETMYDIATSLGYTQEQFTELMVTVRTDAINQALADGVLTQEQADWMLSRLTQRAQGGFGDGTCTGSCQMGGRGGRGGGFGGGMGGGGIRDGSCLQP